MQSIQLKIIFVETENPKYSVPAVYVNNSDLREESVTNDGRMEYFEGVSILSQVSKGGA